MNENEMIFIFAIVLFSIYTIFRVWCYFYNKKLYEATTYFKLTNIPYLKIRHDLGHSGEYQIYKILKSFELEGAKFLFNLYVPTYNNKTTEIDVVMIAPQGIFVFESKNYGGWIFGTESRKKWTQTFHVGYGETHKEYFYNPIMQNTYHIEYLHKLLEQAYKYYSIIVFSNDCEFKEIIRNSNSKSHLIYRYELYETVCNIMSSEQVILSDENILQIYNKLYPYSQVDESVKLQHIKNLKNK